MDNIVFNVKGVGSENLLKALELIIEPRRTVKGWTHHPEKGMILVWCKGKGDNDLPGNMTASQVLPLVESYLLSDEAAAIELGEWDIDQEDYDIKTESGWRVYVEDWGKVARNDYAICAIIPSFAWYGK